MVVQMRAVEQRQAVGVVRKMRGGPIHDDAEPGLMCRVDEGHEIFRRAVPAGGGEIPRGLVSPGAVEGMLRNRHQLQMRIAEILGIGNQPVRQFPIGEPSMLFFGNAHPRSQVNFVHGNRCLDWIPFGARRHPLSVMPLVAREIAHHGGGAGPQFRGLRVGVRLAQDGAVVPGADFVLVEGVFGNIGNEQLPEAGGAAVRHGMAPAVPPVEVSDHADPCGIRGPHDEMNPRDPVHRTEMGAKRPIGLVQGPFGEEMQLEVRQQRWKGVRIVTFCDRAVLVHEAEAVGRGGRPCRCQRLKKPGVVQTGHGNSARRAMIQQFGSDRARPPRPDDEALFSAIRRWMRTQHRARIPMGPGDQPIDVVIMQGCL